MTETTAGNARSAAEIMGERQPDSITKSTVTLPAPLKVEIEHKISFTTAWFLGIGLAGGIATAIAIFQIASRVTKGWF